MLNKLGQMLVTTGLMVFYLTIGTASGPGSRAIAQVHRKCVPDTTAGCSTCESTNNVYQCLTNPLATGQYYGQCIPSFIRECILPTSPPSCASQPTAGDYTCDQPPMRINGSNLCDTNLPDVCSKM